MAKNHVRLGFVRPGERDAIRSWCLRDIVAHLAVPGNHLEGPSGQDRGFLLGSAALERGWSDEAIIDDLLHEATQGGDMTHRGRLAQLRSVRREEHPMGCAKAREKDLCPGDCGLRAPWLGLKKRGESRMGTEERLETSISSLSTATTDGGVVDTGSVGSPLVSRPPPSALPDGATMPDHALAYAAQGYHVFPCYGISPDGQCDCGGLPSCKNGKNAGKHPRAAHGHLDATTDATQIRAWWADWPTANIGINCRRSGIVVLDEDSDARYDGTTTLLIAMIEHGWDRDTYFVRTGGGGRHHYFKAREGAVYPKELGHGLHVKHDGYVIAPPSLHKSGRRYTVGGCRELLEAPAWLEGGP